MELSIVIVNYNVRYFLEQVLVSVQVATSNIEAEIFVVDNNSVDDSVSMLKAKFPEVKLIANTNNPGFSIANNQALRIAKGKYQLLLNPDTVVEEDTFIRCIDFFEKHPEAGALGVKMIDGSGNFLPESKRGFPSPFVAFSKIFGLASLFPKSKIFGRYHLGYLDKNENCEVDVLAGAFMMIRKTVLDKIGLLDEQFFMYGEDIDLSYRIKNAGYKNYYFSDTQIIHYKGESTKKGSLNYVHTFYNAMILFAKKHFSKQKAGTFTLLIRVAIYFTASITLLRNLISKSVFLIADFILMFLCFILLKDFWANYFYKDPNWFNDSIYYVNFPIYCSVFVGVNFFNGAYDRPFELGRHFRGLFFGLILVAGIYGFLNLEYRSSRALILLGFSASLISTTLFRLVFHYFKFGSLNLSQNKKNRLMLVGSKEECSRAINLLNKAEIDKNILGNIASDASQLDDQTINHIGQLEEIVSVFKLNELIFCSKDISMRVIMDWMTRLGPKVDYKILPANSLSIIGSSSKHNSGELYTIDIQYNIDTPLYRRNKRLFDIIMCFALIIILPFIIFFIKNKLKFIQNWFDVFIGKRTWVSYIESLQDNNGLPWLKLGVLLPTSSFKKVNLNAATINRLNSLYAKDYRIYDDFEIMVRNFKSLGA